MCSCIARSRAARVFLRVRGDLLDGAGVLAARKEATADAKAEAKAEACRRRVRAVMQRGHSCTSGHSADCCRTARQGSNLDPGNGYAPRPF
jgi:hypothetical protein